MRTDPAPGSPVYEALCAFFHAYLTERSLIHTLALVTEDICAMSSRSQSPTCGKAEFSVLLQEEFHAVPESISFSILSWQERPLVSGFFTALCQIQFSRPSLPAETAWLSAGFREESGRLLAFELRFFQSDPAHSSLGFLPLRPTPAAAHPIGSQEILQGLSNKVLPGGIVGNYLAPGFPFYLVNDDVLNMLGYTYEELMADTRMEIASLIHPDDLSRVEHAVSDGLAAGEQYEVEYRLRRKDGCYLWVYDTGRKIIADDGRPALFSMILDISDRVRFQQLLQEASVKDFLTGIHNRRGAEEAVRRQLDASTAPYGFLLLDLDDFKQINDHGGHITGDAILRETAGLLQRMFPEHSVCARLGGDEFVVLAMSIPSAAALETQAQALNTAYKDALARLCPGAQSGLSIGGLFSSRPRTFDALYSAADKLLYEVKRDHKDAVCIRDES